MSRKRISFRFAPYRETQANLPQPGSPMTYKGEKIGQVISSSEVDGVVTAEIDEEHVPMIEKAFEGLGVVHRHPDPKAN